MQQQQQQPQDQVADQSGAKYIQQLSAVCQFLRQEGFVQAERQLLSELEQKFPSIGRLNVEEDAGEGERSRWDSCAVIYQGLLNAALATISPPLKSLASEVRLLKCAAGVVCSGRPPCALDCT